MIHKINIKNLTHYNESHISNITERIQIRDLLKVQGPQTLLQSGGRGFEPGLRTRFHRPQLRGMPLQLRIRMA